MAAATPSSTRSSTSHRPIRAPSPSALPAGTSASTWFAPRGRPAAARFQTQGLDGLKDLPPIHKSHPQTTPEPVVERIRDLALAHPAYGCNRHEAMLAPEGIRVSAITIQKILNDKGLGTRVERWLALEAKNAVKAISITPEQAGFLEKLNPCFRERHVESAAPVGSGRNGARRPRREPCLCALRERRDRCGGRSDDAQALERKRPRAAGPAGQE